MSSFALNDKQNSNAGERDATHRLGSLPVPAVPRAVKVSCNRPKYPEAICWKGPTFFDPTQQNPTPDPMRNQADNSTMTHSPNIQNSSVDESSDDASPPPRAMDSSIRYVDDIIIESGKRILECKKSQIATQITTIRALEAPISESIYDPPKFETNVNASRLGKKAAWASSHQHSFLGLRYTTYEPSSKTFRRKRAALGLDIDGTFTVLRDNSDAHQAIGTQSDISYGKLIDVMKAIPKYFSDRPKYKRKHLLFKKTNNCNSFVYSMAKQAGLSDIAKLHHTISPGSAANKILKHMRRGKIDSSRVRVEFDGTKSHCTKRPVFVQEKGVVSLGLNNNEFLTEAHQIMGKHSKRRSDGLPDALQVLQTTINKINKILKELPTLNNKDEMDVYVQALFPLLTTIDSNILKTVKLASGKHKMLQIYLMGIQDFFHTVRNELLGLSSYSSSSDSSSSDSSSSDSSSSDSSSLDFSSLDFSSLDFSSLEQEDPIDSETPYAFEHRPSAQTAFCFRSLLDDASSKNYTKDLLKLSKENTAYEENLPEFIYKKNVEQLYNNTEYDSYTIQTLASKKMETLNIQAKNNNITTRESFLNNIILGNYESDFTTLMKSLKNRNPEQPINAIGTYYTILKLYQAALKDPQSQRSLANYMDVYQSITHSQSKQQTINNIVHDLQYHLQSTFLDAGIYYGHDLLNMFSYENTGFNLIKENYLQKDLDTVRQNVLNNLNLEKSSDDDVYSEDSSDDVYSEDSLDDDAIRDQHNFSLARNAQKIFHSMIYYAIQEANLKSVK